MQHSVRCSCNVQRVIDIAQVGPWRLRCKQCGDVLYDPSSQPRAAAPPPAPTRPPPRPRPTPQAQLEAKAEQVLRSLTPPPSHHSDAGEVEDSSFQRWLEGSGELKVLLSSDGTKAPKCDRHPTRRIVAACTRCSALLCKYCLDRIDDEFACSECVAQVATKMDDQAGVMSWFKKIFGKGRR